MKNFSWQQWVAISLIIVVIITAIVLHLIQPNISFLFTDLIALLSFALGVLVDRLLVKKKDKQTNDNVRQYLFD